MGKGFLRTYFACLLGVVIQGCILPETTTHSPVYHGKVLDAATEEPVSGATVQLQGPDLETSAKSDAAGNFKVGPLKCTRLVLAVPFGEGRVPQDCKHIFPDNLQLRLMFSHKDYETAVKLVPLQRTNYTGQVDVGILSLYRIQIPP